MKKGFRVLGVGFWLRPEPNTRNPEPSYHSSLIIPHSSFLLLRARAESELGWRGQRRGLVVFARGLFARFAAGEPAREGGVVAREDARKPVRPVLPEPE